MSLDLTQFEEPGELENLANELIKWSKSYPVSVFGEPTPEEVDKVCKDSGFSIDKISAMVLRHFTKRWFAMAELAIIRNREPTLLAEVKKLRALVAFIYMGIKIRNIDTNEIIETIDEALK